MQPCTATYTVPPECARNGHRETSNERKADAICEKIAKGLDENKIVGSANVIAYALKESRSAGFEERRKYPPKESKSNLWLGCFAVEACQTLHGYVNSDAPDKSKFLALSQQRGHPHLAF